MFSLNLGKKRVWVPDEQDAYVEAEVKSEATGGRVNVETKDQKVLLPLSLVLAPPDPSPPLPLPTSPQCAAIGQLSVLHCMASLTDADGAGSRAAAHEPASL